MIKETKEAVERLCELVEEAYPHETPKEVELVRSVLLGEKPKGERYCERCAMQVPSDKYHNCIVCGQRTH